MANVDGFDAGKVPPMEEYTPIPEGEYKAIAVKSEFKPTKSGDGAYLEFVWEVLDGEYAKRQLWSRLNLQNKSEQAVKIAKSEFSSICRAAGVLRPRDSEEVHNKPIIVKVAVEDRNDGKGKTNRIKAYRAIDSQAPAHSPAAPAASSASNSLPWR